MCFHVFDMRFYAFLCVFMRLICVFIRFLCVFMQLVCAWYTMKYPFMRLYTFPCFFMRFHAFSYVFIRFHTLHMHDGLRALQNGHDKNDGLREILELMGKGKVESHYVDRPLRRIPFCRIPFCQNVIKSNRHYSEFPLNRKVITSKNI